MNLRKIVPLFILFCWPVISFAQIDTATTISTTTAQVSAVEEDLWYEVETISGRLDVGDFVVGPGRAEITLAPGQTAIREITVTNRISEDRTFKLEVVDISGTRDGSAALRVVEDGRGPYSIQDYVSFPEDTFTLSLGERAVLPITVNLPADAEPGGYYGSILVSTVRAGSAASGDPVPRNPIIARVGSHLFITVEGEEMRSGQVLDMSVLPTQWWYESGPMNFGIAYENTGSVHLNPYGELSVTNLFGDEIGYMELDPWFVLPQSIRTREVLWERDFLFGRYTAKATINRGYDDILDEVEVTFWVLPWKLLLIIFGSIFFVIFVIRFFFRTFEFKRR